MMTHWAACHLLVLVSEGGGDEEAPLAALAHPEQPLLEALDDARPPELHAHGLVVLRRVLERLACGAGGVLSARGGASGGFQEQGAPCRPASRPT